MNDFPGYIYVLQDVSVTGFYKIGRALGKAEGKLEEIYENCKPKE
jgi:hypothetical protein